MPVAQSSEAGRAVASNLQARRQQLAADAREQARADLAAQRADTTTPLGETKAAFEMEELFSTPAPPVAPAERPAPEPVVVPRVLVMSITILYRGRMITISSEGRTLDEFSDLLDKRLGVAS